MASRLAGTDPRCFRPCSRKLADPIIVELREWSRIAEDLGIEQEPSSSTACASCALALLPGPARTLEEATSASNRLLELWEAALKRRIQRGGSHAQQATIAKLLKRHRTPSASTPPSWSTRCAGCRPRCRRRHRNGFEAASAHGVALLVPRSPPAQPSDQRRP